MHGGSVLLDLLHSLEAGDGDRVFAPSPDPSKGTLSKVRSPLLRTSQMSASASRYSGRGRPSSKYSTQSWPRSSGLIARSLTNGPSR
jgi:hypothetical protein